MSHKKKPTAPDKSGKATDSLWRKEGLFPALVVVVALALYAKTLSFDFVYHDDDTMIVNNHQNLERANLKTVLLTDAWFRKKEIQLYRPWQSLTYVIDYKIWKDNPAGYHLHNVVVFAVSLLVLYYFLQQLGFSRQWAFLLTLFYSCHYLFAHAACWIPARGDLYLTLFGLSSMISFLKYFRNRLWKDLLRANVFFFLALLAKETAAVIVPVAVLLRWVELKWDVRQLKSFIGLWLLPSLLLAGIYLTLRGRSIDATGYVGLGGALYNLPVIPESVFKFFIPGVFCVLPGYNFTFTIIGVAILLGMTALVFALKSGEKRLLSLAGLAMFLLSMLPSVLYKPTFSRYAYDYLDHRMFFAGIGLLIFAGAAFTGFPSNAFIARKLAIGLCVVEAGFTLYCQDAYRDFHHYYENGISTNPRSALAMLNYGILLREKDRDFQKSLSVLRKGSGVHPDSTSFMNEIAGTCFAMGDYDGMYAAAQAMARYPDRQYEAMLYSGIYYSGKGLMDSALGAYNHAIELRPHSYAALLNRARVHKQLKNWNATEADLTEAIRLNPDSADAYADRGNLYGNLGFLDKTLSDYSKYVSLRPEDASGFYNRGQALLLMGRKVEGCNDLRRAAEMGLLEAIAKYSQLCN